MTFLCLNLLSGEAIYRLTLRPLVSRLRAPEFTVSYQQIPMNIFEGWRVSLAVRIRRRYEYFFLIVHCTCN